MIAYTHIKCLEDVVEEEVVIFKKGEVYKILGYDYKSLVFYVEPEFYEEGMLPDEFAVPPLHPSFEFIRK